MKITGNSEGGGGSQQAKFENKRMELSSGISGLGAN